MRRLILWSLALCAGCSSTPALQAVPCPAPPPLPAELAKPAEYPQAIKALNDYMNSLKRPPTPQPGTPPG